MTQHDTVESEAEPRWEPPGPGTWTLDQAHFSGVVTPIGRVVHKAMIEEGFREMFKVVGAPVSHLEEAFVHGRPYLRMVQLVGDGSDKGPPPKPVLWLATRLHPAFRRRRRMARRFLGERAWRAVVEEWNTRERAEWARRNRALQDEPLDGLDDAGLTDHLERVRTHVHEAGVRHFVLHGYDMGPLGLFLVNCARWGIEPSEGLDALAGSSPATTEPTRLLRRLGELVHERAATPPASLDEVRALGDDVAGLLDAYLAERGWVLITRYDVDGRTLGELPEVVLASILSGGERAPAPVDELVASLRDRVPEGDRAEFDRLLDEARSAYGMRDDNGPMTIEWPLGLLRRVLLEAGRRFVASDRLEAVAHVFELELDEVRTMLGGAAGPGAAAAAERAERRRREGKLPAPAVLGPEEEPPDMSILPDPFPLLLDAIDLLMKVMEGEAKGALQGSGIGREPYRGTARVAWDAADALARMEPGDVLVVPLTTPTYNTVLAIAGGLVVEQGGLLSHAALIARELDLPAVIGAAEATTRIADGDLVEVDPVAGSVRVVERAETAPA